MANRTGGIYEWLLEHKEEMEAADRGNKMRRCRLEQRRGLPCWAAPQWVLISDSLEGRMRVRRKNVISLWCVNSYGHFLQPQFTGWKISKIPNHKGEKQRLFSKKIQVDLETQGYSWECSLLMQRMKMSPRCWSWGAGAAGWPAPHSPSSLCWHEGQALTMGREVSRSTSWASCFYMRGWARTTLHVIAQQNEKKYQH